MTKITDTSCKSTCEIRTCEIRRYPFTGGGLRAYEICDVENGPIYLNVPFDTIGDAIAHFESELAPRGDVLSATCCEPWPDADA